VGASWNVAVPTAAKISTPSYDLRAFTAGTKTYLIKAIDTSGQYSLNAALASITITAVPAMNVVYTYNDFLEGPAGALSGEAMVKWTKSYNAGYYRRAIGLRTNPRWATKTGTWVQAATAGDKFNTPMTTLTGQYVSGTVDIGAVLTIEVIINLKTANVAGGALTIEISTSNDNVTFSPYQGYSPGRYTGRYFKFRITLSTTNSLYDLEIYDFEAVFDADDIIQSGAGVSIASGGTTITFPIPFNAPPNLISIVVTPQSSLIAEVVSGSKTKTNFQCKVKDPATLAYTSGVVDWYAKGY